MNQQTASGTKYSGFVYKSCAETFSFGYTWFTNSFNVVCDAKDVSALCTLKMENANGYETLGEKSLNLWRFVHSSNDVEEIIVKIDDDTMIQKHLFDEFIDEFAKRDAIIAGMINTWGGEFYWPLGRLYMFKRSALPPSDSVLWANATTFNKFEDAQIGYLINTTDIELTYHLDEERFWHADFEDDRVKIVFKHLSATCGVEP
ncbi:hypothetical protein BG011_000177 [Mortierella polycephala]|uniref:Uncharacterized protein n=1 Tax=Mortierella polycephala TaxID=41804 RepID=A0A9P6PLH2_9FUNG|nr:hypothetical protein BG011_000177 [Mortierella polycephala]